MANSPDGKRDFFISFNKADRAWATWVAWVLEDAGHSVLFQDWDFKGNFVLEMDRAHKETRRTIAILSPDYVNSRFTAPEWAARFAQDATSEHDLLIPVRVRDFDPKGLLAQIIYIDLVDATQEQARERLVNRVAGIRLKPKEEPFFPGGPLPAAQRSIPSEPAFPATLDGPASTQHVAQSHAKPPVAGKRKWFDLKTARGWIEALGVFVTVVGSAVGVYLQLFPNKEPDKKPEAAGITISGTVTAQNNSPVVIGSPHTTIQITGYTIEQHEQRLKAREQELREVFQATLGQSEERRKTIEREFQAVQGQLGNLQTSYEERLAELKRIAGELEALRGQVPDAKLREALDALGQGKTKLADALFAEVENNEQRGIERAARAAFERGRIAYQEVRWQEARSHFEKADRLVPEHAEYSYWAALLAWELGDFPTAIRDFENTLRRVRKEKGEDAPEAAGALNNLALLYQALGRFTEAEPLYRRALAILESKFGPSHSNTRTVAENLATLLKSSGRPDEADAVLKKINAGTR